MCITLRPKFFLVLLRWTPLLPMNYVSRKLTHGQLSLSINKIMFKTIVINLSEIKFNWTVTNVNICGINLPRFILINEFTFHSFWSFIIIKTICQWRSRRWQQAEIKLLVLCFIHMAVSKFKISSIKTWRHMWRHDLWLASICDCGTICDHIMLQFVTRHDLWPKVLQFVTSVIQWF